MGENTKSKDTNNNISNNLKFPNKITNKNTQKYESFNVVSETGDSIYYVASPFEEQIVGGQIFVAESITRETVRQELAAAIGVLVKSENE